MTEEIKKDDDWIDVDKFFDDIWTPESIEKKFGTDDPRKI